MMSMTRRSPDILEVGSLIVIAIAIALGGRALLATLHGFGAAALVGLAIAAIGLVASMRRLSAVDGIDRLELTRRATYLCAVVLAVWGILALTRAAVGATLAMLELALVFDIVTRLSPRREA
jgi:hypothetical protein